MRHLLIIIFAMFSMAAYSQGSADDILARAKAGLLTYEECMAMPDEYSGSLMPSLKLLKKIYSSAEGYDGARYNDVMMKLYRFFMSKGNVNVASLLLEEAAVTFSRREKEQNNVYMRNLLVCWGRLEMTMGNFDEALFWLMEAYRCCIEKNDCYGDRYLMALFNISISCFKLDDKDTGRAFMGEAKAMFEKLHGCIYDVTDEKLFFYLASYGALCAYDGRYEEAERCLLPVVSSSATDLISGDVRMNSLLQLSSVYMLQGRWNDAARLLKGQVSLNNDCNYQVAQNLCQCFLFLNDTARAIDRQKVMNRLFFNRMKILLTFMPQTERDNYWMENSGNGIFVNNLVASKSGSPQSVGIAYDYALVSKGLMLDFSRVVEGLVAKSGSKDLDRRLAEYKRLKQQLVYKANAALKDSLAEVLKNAEQSVLIGINDYGDWMEHETATWRDVRNALADDEIAIEYSYVPVMRKYPDWKADYGAFVLRKDSEWPVLVSLADKDSTEDVLYGGQEDAMAINHLYTGRADTLRQMLWQKLKPYLKGVKTVYYAPTGLLSELNFDALTDDDGRMLGEKYSMVRLSSTAGIPKVKKSGALSLHSAALYGNIAYDESVEDMAAASAKSDKFTGEPIQRQLSLRSENERGRWGDISSTKKEIDSIKSILRNDGVEVTAFEGTQASEESFKAMSGKSPDVIHLATHGFAISTPQQAQGNKFTSSTTLYTSKDFGMIWTGLILAGGNNVWQGKFNVADVEDGVLTADEISRLDLSRTKLVVLSACETGKGEIDPIDGVYGLQRAFKMAGAGTIVMSLWQVQDDATSLLMTRFYTYLAGGHEKRRALWLAMMDVKARYHDPYYWAGFVMLE